MRAEKLNNSRYHDYDALPILFLYQHSMELFLKAIIMVGLDANLDLLITKEKLFNTHKMKDLFPVVKKILQYIFSSEWPDNDIFSFLPFLKEMGKLVDEIDDISKFSTAFRFPLDKDNNCIKPKYLFNVLDLSDKLEPLCKFLEQALDVVINNLEPQMY